MTATWHIYNLSAGTHSIATTNGTGTMSLTIVEQDGRKWAKIPWGSESSGSIDGGHGNLMIIFCSHLWKSQKRNL